MLANANTWDDLTVKVHAKFTISAPFDAGQPILYSTTPSHKRHIQRLWFRKHHIRSIPKYYLS
jgi:hypothetical protein